MAAAMDHLRLALEEPPELTFRPVLRALRVHAVETGSFWSALDLLDVERKAAADPVERADLAVEKAYLLGHPLDAPARAREVLEEALSQQPGHAAALLALEENTLGALGRGGGAADGALLQSVLERRLAAARTSGERGRLLCRLALLAEADPTRIADALGLWLRALEEEDGKGELRQRASWGAAALARAGARRAAAGLGRYPELARVVALEAEATAGPERAGWLSLGAALARHRLGAPARADELIEAAHAADPADPAPLFAMTSAALATGQWSKARLALDRQAELTRDRDWAATLQGLGAHIAELHEGNDDAAAGRYRRLLEARAADPVALAALERIASRTGDAAAQVALAESAVDRSGDPAERAALAMRAAELAETAGHDLPRAAALARRALEAVAGYAPAAHLLERLLPALGRWDEMAKVVEVTAAPTSLGDGGTSVGAEAAVRLERLGALYEDRLGDPGKALALYGEWVELGTRRGAALGALLAGRREGRRRAGRRRSGAAAGDGDPGVRQGHPLRLVLSRGDHLRRAGGGRRRGGARLRGGAGAGARVAARAGGAGARAPPARSVRGAGRRAVAAGRERAEPHQRLQLRGRGGAAVRAAPRAAGRRAGSDQPGADVRSGQRRGRRRARPPAAAAGARRRAGRGAGHAGADAVGSRRQGGRVPRAGGGAGMAARAPARGAGGHRAGGRHGRRLARRRRRGPIVAPRGAWRRAERAPSQTAGQRRRDVAGRRARRGSQAARAAPLPRWGCAWISPGTCRTPRPR